MSGPNRIIIDTDPGVDDVLAMLLAFASKAEELQVLLLSVTHGNVEVQTCLRNIVSLFHTIEKELVWRRENGRPEGFEALKACKPIVAVGAEEPLADQLMLADYFHGIDGLGGIHASHPYLSPSDTWKTLFRSALKSSDPEERAAAQELQDCSHSLFIPSQRPAHEEMLRILRENEPNTITIVAVGPLTNVAIAAATDPETFLRVKEVVVMGGAIDVPGNMSPGAEFNIFADSVAAARVFALTSPNPVTTMPIVPAAANDTKGHLGPYPEKLSKRLNLKLFPLDITTPHLLPRQLFNAHTAPLTESPLAIWVTAFVTATYNKVLSLKPEQSNPDPMNVGLELHDPLCVWYALTHSDPGWQFTQDEDIRVETAGQWTRGSCVTDRREKRMKEGQGSLVDEVPGDTGKWKDTRAGNRVSRCLKSPGVEKFAQELLVRAFGLTQTG